MRQRREDEARFQVVGNSGHDGQLDSADGNFGNSEEEGSGGSGD
jgi:hypothetical protein